MSNRTRVAAETRRNKESRSKKIKATVGLGTAGLALVFGALRMTADEVQPELPALTAKQAEFLEQYDCNYKNKIVVKSQDLSDKNKAAYGTGGEGLAFTVGNTITVEKKLPIQKAANTILHEMVHACTDEQPVTFSRNYQIQSGLTAVGAQGFKVWFADSTPEKPNTFNMIEEGVAEWIASDFKDYQPSGSRPYQAVHRLTGLLAERGQLSRQEVFDMHENSQLEEFIAASGRKPEAELTDTSVGDFIFLYNRAFEQGKSPSASDLDAYFSYGQ